MTCKGKIKLKILREIQHQISTNYAQLKFLLFYLLQFTLFPLGLEQGVKTSSNLFLNRYFNLEGKCIPIREEQRTSIIKILTSSTSLLISYSLLKHFSETKEPARPKTRVVHYIFHAQDFILVKSISVYLCDHSNSRESGLEPLLSAIG